MLGGCTVVSSILLASKVKSSAKAKHLYYDLKPNDSGDAAALSLAIFSRKQLNIRAESPSPRRTPVSTINCWEISPLNLTLDIVYPQNHKLSESQRMSENLS